MLSVTTDYATDKGCPEPYLKRIAETGFSHIHWCHQWYTDFVYAEPEIEQIAVWLKEYGLVLNDLHAPYGMEKCWASPLEYERRAGVELVKNRIAMTARLGSDVIVMHADPCEKEGYADGFWDRLRRSLDELEPVARDHGVRIALENGPFPIIRRALSEYAPDYLGLCYDCGHGNIGGEGLDGVETLKDRLIAVHLHDNDGTRDQHNLPFSGTVDWKRLARIMATSSYTKPVNMEITMVNSGFDDEQAFLDKAFRVGTEFSAMIAAEKGAVT